MSEQIKTLHEEVADRLAKSIPILRAEIVEELADKVLRSRSEMLLNAIEELSKLSKERSAILKKPANVSYDENGNKVGESYSKEQIDSKKKAEDRFAKISKLVDEAFEKNDNETWGKLQGALNGK